MIDNIHITFRTVEQQFDDIQRAVLNGEHQRRRSVRILQIHRSAVVQQQFDEICFAVFHCEHQRGLVRLRTTQNVKDENATTTNLFRLHVHVAGFSKETTKNFPLISVVDIDHCCSHHRCRRRRRKINDRSIGQRQKLTGGTRVILNTDVANVRVEKKFDQMPMTVTDAVVQRGVPLQRQNENIVTRLSNSFLTFLSCRLIRRSRRKLEKFSLM